MRFEKPAIIQTKGPLLQCIAIIQPGEFTISNWDGLRCSSTGNTVALCSVCQKPYCLLYHFHRHFESHLVSDQDETENELLEKVNEECPE